MKENCLQPVSGGFNFMLKIFHVVRNRKCRVASKDGGAVACTVQGSPLVSRCS